MADFYSYAPLLIKYLRLKKPETILEWGPGASTDLIVGLCPKATIHTYEHDLTWYQAARFHFLPLPRVHVHHVADEEECAKAPAALGLRFDLIFIDGRARLTCLETAKGLLAEDGVVILHDSDRLEYAGRKALYRVLEESDGTAVMTFGHQ